MTQSSNTTLTVDDLAQRVGAALRGDGSLKLSRCEGLEEAGPESLSFLANKKYARLLANTKAGAVVVGKDDVASAPAGLTLLIADDPYFAFRQAVVALHGFRKHPGPAGASKQAIVHPEAQIGEGCTIMPLAYVECGAKIGTRCVIYPHCYVGRGAVVGDDCILFPGVTVYDGCVLGNRVTLHAGCVIGQDGFGYATHKGAHHKIPQIGNAVVEDDVEMGANCAVDRATVGSTRIGKGTKFSDLVAIGHGATIGAHNLLVAQVGIAGSTETGDYVVMAGQVGVAGHLTIGKLSKFAGQAGVVGDVPENSTYGGSPAIPLQTAKRSLLAMAKLPELAQDFRKMQRRVAELEKRLAELDKKG